MKIYGLTFTNVAKIAKDCDSALIFKAAGVGAQQSKHGPTGSMVVTEGYLCYTSHAMTPWRAEIAGKYHHKYHHKPCFHMAMRVVQALRAGGAAIVHYEKVKFCSGEMSSSRAKVLQKVKARGESCNCPDSNLSPVGSSPVPQSAIPPASWSTPTPNPAQTVQKYYCVPNGQVFNPIDFGGFGDLKQCPLCKQAGIPAKFSPSSMKHVKYTAGLVIPSTTPIAVEAPVATPKVSSNPIYTAPMLDYPPLLANGGETTKVVNGAARHTFGATVGLYVLQDLYLALTDGPVRVTKVPKGFRVDGKVTGYEEHVSFAGEDGENYNIGLRMLWHEFTTFKREYELRLARNMFDYLVMACAGESRYDKSVRAWCNESAPQSRSEAWSRAVQYDPRTLLPVIETVFRKGNTKNSGSYGGKLWANIAKSAGLYFKFLAMPLVFADHVVDLKHNGGLAWNKGYGMNMPNESSYLAMLDYKRKASLLGWRGKTLECNADVVGFVRRVQGYCETRGFYRTVGDDTVWHETSPGLKVLAGLTPVNDTKVPTIKWGSETFSVGGKENVTKQTQTEDDDTPQTYSKGASEEYPPLRPGEKAS